MNDIAIKVEHVSKTFRIPHENIDTLRERLFNFQKKLSYETFKALDDISIEVKKGEFFGIIGRNGSGKSTLLKILAGIYTTDKGFVDVNGEISPFLELGVGFNPELSGKDNIYLNGIILGLSKKEIDKKFNAIVEFSELEQFIDLKLKNYSSGMYVRLAFSVAIHANKGILLMDEVLAVGDVNFQVKCLDEFNRYRALGNTVILVTHDIKTVQQSCDRAMMLDKGRLIKFGDAREICEEYIYQNSTAIEKQMILEQKQSYMKKVSGSEPINDQQNGKTSQKEGSHVAVKMLNVKLSDSDGPNNYPGIYENAPNLDDTQMLHLVKSLYLGLLGREIDPVNLVYWLDEIKKGLKAKIVLYHILNGEEYRTRIKNLVDGSDK